MVTKKNKLKIHDDRQSSSRLWQQGKLPVLLRYIMLMLLLS